MTPSETSSEALPLISVVVPTYHRNDLLMRCLDRLAPGVQTLPAEQYEVLVCDDGRQTTAREMVAERYPFARWFQGPGKGPGPNRNVGAREARGEFVAFVDDDCVPSPNWLAAFAAVVKPEVDVYEGRTTCELGIRNALEDSPCNEVGGALWTCNLMIRRSAFWTLGGFDENFRIQEDLDLRLRIVQTGVSCTFVPAAVVDHPPRPIRWGRQNHNFDRDLVAVWFKSGQTESIRRRLLRFVFRERLARLRQFPLSAATVKALISMGEELWNITRHVDAWEREFRERYGGRGAAYPFPYPHF
jgi:Predicted glycosyltransferases